MLAAGASLANWEKVDEIIEALDNNSKKYKEDNKGKE